MVRNNHELFGRSLSLECDHTLLLHDINQR